MTSVYEEIKSMLSAGFPLIYLATTEYNRVMQKVRSICFSMGYKFHTWDAVDGLRTHVCNAGYKLQDVRQHEEHDNTEDPYTLLEYFGLSYDPTKVLEREQYWKRCFDTIKNGYNDN